MKRSNMTITPTMIALTMNPFRYARGGYFSRLVNRRPQLRPILLVLCLLLSAVSCSYLRRPGTSEKPPSPPSENKDPVISMLMASSIDSKGQLTNPRFTFPPSEPQMTAVVRVGKINGPDLTVVWFKTSEDGDQKLFAHQIKVKSNDLAFSVGKNQSGTLAAGTYKIVATLEGQTKEMAFDVSPAKALNKTLNNRPERLFENQVQLKGNGRAFSVEDNSAVLLAAGTYAVAGELEGQIQKVVWEASSQTADATPTGSATEEGNPPVEGPSGTVEQRPKPQTGEDQDCSLGSSTFVWDYDADKLELEVYGTCSPGAASSVNIYAAIDGAPREVGVFPAGKSPDRALNGPFNSVVRNVDPCWLPGGSDLPGTKVRMELSVPEIKGASYTQDITLSDDTLAPRVSVNSSPPKGTKVKAGDVIKIDATASETRSGGPWQTGVQRFQFVRKGSGGGIEELIQEITDPSRLPKPCAQKSWSKVLAASYKIPNNPPPVIKLCAIAEDYAENKSFKCAEFPTADIWEGTLNTDVTVAIPGYSCTGGKWQAKIKIVAGEDGTVSGDLTVVDASKSSCSDGKAGGPYALVGSKWPITGVVNDAGFTFLHTQFIGQGPGTVQGSAFIKKSGRNQASGTSTTQYVLNGVTDSFVMQVDLKCKTCAP